MNTRSLAGFALLGFASVSVHAQAPGIEHQPVACVAAEKFPRIDARFVPNDGIAAARIVFQSDKTDQWWSVAMKPEGPAYFGVLPKPKKSLKAFRYYVEVTDKALGTSRTPDYLTSVVGSRGECSGKLMATSLGSAAVILQGPAGALASLPAGFASTGVIAGSSSATVAGGSAAAAGGGGISTGLIVAGVGAAAAGVAVAVVSKGEGGNSSYEGPFNGQASFIQVYTDGSVFCSGTFSLVGTVQITLDHESGPVNGTLQTFGTNTPSGSCGTLNFALGGPGVPLTGTAGSFTGRNGSPLTSTGPSTVTTNLETEFSGGLSGGVIAGTLTFTRSVSSTDGSGRVSAGKGSFAVPVRLTRR